MLEKLKRCNYRYLNLNPLNRQVNDCVIRSLALANNKSWYEMYEELSNLAKEEAILLDDSNFVEKYLNERYEKVKYRCNKCKLKVKDICETLPIGTYLITMRGHITCLKDGIVYDIWDCTEKTMWCVWIVK